MVLVGARPLARPGASGGARRDRGGCAVRSRRVRDAIATSRGKDSWGEAGALPQSAVPAFTMRPRASVRWRDGSEASRPLCSTAHQHGPLQRGQNALQEGLQGLPGLSLLAHQAASLRSTPARPSPDRECLDLLEAIAGPGLPQLVQQAEAVNLHAHQHHGALAAGQPVNKPSKSSPGTP